MPGVREFEAKLVDPTQGLFTFRDVDGAPTVYKLWAADREQQAVLTILSFRVEMHSWLGLPQLVRPTQALNHHLLVATMRVPDLVVFVGIRTSSNGTEAAAAIVIRKPLRAGDGERPVFWSSRYDMADPPTKWPGEEERLGRVYGGGTKFVIGTIALIAACRAVKQRIDEMQAGGIDLVAAIVVENSNGSMTDALTEATSYTGARIAERNQLQSVNSHFKQIYRAEFDKIRRFTVLAETHFSMVAQHTARQKQYNLPTLGPHCSPEELGLFENHVASRPENRQRIAQQQTTAAAADSGMQQSPTLSRLGALVDSPESFARTTRANRPRGYVPQRGVGDWANILHNQLALILNSEPGKRRDDATVAFFLLPNIYLPVKGSTEHILRRMKQNDPHSLTIKNAQQQQQQQQDRPQTDAATSGDTMPPAAPAATARNVDDDDDGRDGGEDQGAAAAAGAAGGEAPVAHDDLTVRALLLAREENVTKTDQLISVAGLDDAGLSVQEKKKKDAAVTSLAAAVDRHAAQLQLELDTNSPPSRDSERERAFARLREAVERLASDFKISSARKLIYATVENYGKPDVPFEQKLAALRAKHVACKTPLDARKCDTSLSPKTQPFSRDEVLKIINKMPSQAAPCIDGWNSRHLISAVKAMPEIADLLGEFCAMLLNDGEFGKRVMDIIRLGRLVGIPKPDGGIRPITLTCFFVKLTGGLVWLRTSGAMPQFENQFALGRPDGCGQIVHALRAEYNAGFAILRFDVKNAFQNVQRARVARFIDEQYENQEDEALAGPLKSYFNMLYGETSKLVVFGPSQQFEIVESEEGVRQGDQFSGWFFSAPMDAARKGVRDIVPHAGPRLYMDDLSLTSPPQYARYCFIAGVAALKAVGLEVNMEKSSILCKDKSLIGDYSWAASEVSDGTMQFCEDKYQIETRALAAAHPTLDLAEQRPYRRHVDSRYRDGKVPRRAQAAFVNAAPKPEMPEELKVQHREREAQIADVVLQRNIIELNRHAYPVDPGRVPHAYAYEQTKNVKVCGPDDTFIVLGANITDFYDEYNAQQIKRHCGFFDILDQVQLHPQLAFTMARLSGFCKVRFYASITPPQHAEPVVKAYQKRMIKFLEGIMKVDIAGSEACHHRLGYGIPDYTTHHAALYHDSRNSCILGVRPLEVPLVTKISPSGDLAAHLSAQEHAPWLMYQPRGWDTRLSEEEFRIAMAIRCGALPRGIDFKKISCNCSVGIQSPLDAIAHALNCQHSGFTPAQRHSLVKAAVASVARRYGLPVTIEPTCYAYADGVPHRPDLIVWSVPPVTTDFVVVQQGARPGVAARAAAERKNRQHKGPVAQLGHVFVPFALEAHGHMHSAVSQFVGAVASRLPRHDFLAFSHDLTMAISVALARSRICSVEALLRTSDLKHGIGLDDVRSDDDDALDF